MTDGTIAPAPKGRRRALHHQVYVTTLKRSVRENRKFGKALRRGVPGAYRRQTYKGAGKREREVAARLRTLGWAVWQN